MAGYTRRQAKTGGGNQQPRRGSRWRSLCTTWNARRATLGVGGALPCHAGGVQPFASASRRPAPPVAAVAPPLVAGPGVGARPTVLAGVAPPASRGGRRGAAGRGAARRFVPTAMRVAIVPLVAAILALVPERALVVARALVLMVGFGRCLVLRAGQLNHRFRVDPELLALDRRGLVRPLLEQLHGLGDEGVLVGGDRNLGPHAALLEHEHCLDKRALVRALGGQHHADGEAESPCCPRPLVGRRGQHHQFLAVDLEFLQIFEERAASPCGRPYAPRRRTGRRGSGGRGKFS
mmetsp:Transcript_16370/g.44496  ORF Transcript_16370/g.44496 Transcript_16370/m.44496 type:complete len:292 (+) Transcript_16370:362-1237(+)